MFSSLIWTSLSSLRSWLVELLSVVLLSLLTLEAIRGEQMLSIGMIIMLSMSALCGVSYWNFLLYCRAAQKLKQITNIIKTMTDRVNATATFDTWPASRERPDLQINSCSYVIFFYFSVFWFIMFSNNIRLNFLLSSLL